MIEQFLTRPLKRTRPDYNPKMLFAYLVSTNQDRLMKLCLEFSNNELTLALIATEMESMLEGFIKKEGLEDLDRIEAINDVITYTLDVCDTLLQFLSGIENNDISPDVIEAMKELMGEDMVDMAMKFRSRPVLSDNEIKNEFIKREDEFTTF